MHEYLEAALALRACGDRDRAHVELVYPITADPAVEEHRVAEDARDLRAGRTRGHLACRAVLQQPAFPHHRQVRPERHRVLHVRGGEYDAEMQALEQLTEHD